MKDPANPHTFGSMRHLPDWIIQNSLIIYLITEAMFTAKFMLSLQ